MQLGTLSGCMSHTHSESEKTTSIFWLKCVFFRTVWWAETFHLASSVSLTTSFFFFFFCSLFSFWPTAAVLTATQRLQKHTRSSLKKKYRYLPTTSNGSLKQRPWAGNVLLLRICSSIVGRAARFNFIHISRLLSKAPFLPARVSLPACFRLVTSSTSLRSLPLPSVIRTDRLKSVLWCWEGSMQCRKIKIIHKFASHSCKNQLNHSNRVFVLCYFPPLQLHRC